MRGRRDHQCRGYRTATRILEELVQLAVHALRWPMRFVQSRASWRVQWAHTAQRGGSAPAGKPSSGPMWSCQHLLCEIIGGACSLATGRSRGCTPGLHSKAVAPEVFDEVRALLAAIDPEGRTAEIRAASTRLAEIIRREARDDRHLLGLARIEEPELVPALERLCSRRT